MLQVRKLFQQLFSFVNVQLFNQLLLRRECCSFSNGEYVKTGLAEVENWIHTAGKDWTGESWDELRYIRQVCLQGRAPPLSIIMMPANSIWAGFPKCLRRVLAQNHGSCIHAVIGMYGNAYLDTLSRVHQVRLAPPVLSKGIAM